MRQIKAKKIMPTELFTLFTHTKCQWLEQFENISTCLCIAVNRYGVIYHVVNFCCCFFMNRTEYTTKTFKISKALQITLLKCKNWFGYDLCFTIYSVMLYLSVEASCIQSLYEAFQQICYAML